LYVVDKDHIQQQEQQPSSNHY